MSVEVVAIKSVTLQNCTVLLRQFQLKQCHKCFDNRLACKAVEGTEYFKFAFNDYQKLTIWKKPVAG